MTVESLSEDYLEKAEEFVTRFGIERELCYSPAQIHLLIHYFGGYLALKENDDFRSLVHNPTVERMGRIPLIGWLYRSLYGHVVEQEEAGNNLIADANKLRSLMTEDPSRTYLDLLVTMSGDPETAYDLVDECRETDNTFSEEGLEELSSPAGLPGTIQNIANILSMIYSNNKGKNEVKAEVEEAIRRFNQH